jgi:hypothetical protein
MRKKHQIYLTLVSYLLFSIPLIGSDKVFYGGVAFVGNYVDFSDNYTFTYPLSLEETEGSSGLQKAFYTRIDELSRDLSNIDLEAQELANLKDGDALVLALAIDGENTSTYHVGSEELGIDVYKMTADLSAQILVFDYQSKTIVSSRPIVLRLVSAKNGSAPLPADFKALYRRMLFDDTSSVNLLNAFSADLSNITVSRKDSGRIQVRKVIIEDKADKWLPEFYLEDKSRLQGFIGRNFTKYLTDNTGANVLPYIGYSTGLPDEARNLTNAGAALGGTMAMRFSGGEVFNLVIPEPDYVVEISMRGFSKSKGKENAGGESWIYGSYINLKVLQPALGKVYFDENLKNVFVSVLVKGFPASKGEDWASFNEATMVLFDLVTQNFLKKPDRKWAKAYGSGKSTVTGLVSVAKILKKCK